MMLGSKILSWVVLGALTLGVVAMLSLVMYQQGISANESEAQQAEITALQAGLAEANTRLEAQGEPPVPVPEVDGDGETPVVPVPPTQDQILSAFDVWCDLRSCHGSDGDDGKNGKDAPPMTREQVLAGFTEWCSTSDLCVGATGADGKDSTVPGPPGRPPTAEEILAAVEVICGTDGGLCSGADGKDGKAGKDGSDGRGILKTECLENGDWIVTYTDGTAGTTTGCRAPAITPTPTPTPSASTTMKK